MPRHDCKIQMTVECLASGAAILSLARTAKRADRTRNVPARSGVTVRSTADDIGIRSKHATGSGQFGNWQRWKIPWRRAKPVADAITAFENHILSLESSTQRKYRNVLVHLREYCDRAGLHDIMQLTVEHLDAFRAGRKLSPTTSTKELQTLRQFFGFCLERRWAEENPEKRIKLPRNIRPEEVVPYTQAEVAIILAACEAIGRGPYERLRAHALD